MRESINDLKNQILAQLSSAVEIENAINASIEMVGRYFNVDRVYIFENSDDDLCCSNTFEWCNEGITPEKDNLQNLRYLEDLGGTWLDNFNEDGVFFCPSVKKLPQAQREVLEPQGIFSMLQSSIRERGEFKGYIGFDNCQDHLGGWENDQDAVDALVFSSRLLSLYLLEYRNKTKQLEYMTKLQEQNDKLERFMGYVCTANETVMEVSLTDFMAKIYTRNPETEKIEVIETPYKQYHHINYNQDIHPEDYDTLVGSLSENALDDMIDNDGGEKYFECRARDSKGEYQWYSYNLQAIPKSKDYPRNFILFKKNIDEAKKEEEKQRKTLSDALETAKEASVAKGFFLSNMSHEIRTPLNAIIGYLSIAQDDDVSEQKIKHCIDNCEVASKHLLQIINDVLDMSAIENGKLKIAYEDFDLKKEIMDITTIFYQNAKNKGINFETHIDDLTVEWVKGDPLRLNQVLMNLLSNAVKFTPEDGKITFIIRQLNEDEHKLYIQFEVSDTGIGMSEEYMARIFTPFEQETAGTARRFGGSGLGLSITHNLVTMMNGTITVKSKQNVGSTFTMTMCFDIASQYHASDATVEDYSHVRILIVDDQKDEGSYVKRMLKRCGVKADMVTNGTEAIRRLEGRKGGDYSYDMCILDWNMPDMNGIEVAKKIRESFGDDLPVIIATAYDVTELEDEAKTAGVNKVVAKPLFQSTLFDLLVSSFGKYKPKSENKKANEHIDMTGVRVILAEDNEMNMDIAVTVLEKAGIAVDQAVNGQMAYELFIGAPEGTYDLILMDVQMPVLDGYAATKKIRESGYPQADVIPIIAMTANAFAEDVTEALSKGMNAHIAKPVNNDKLFKVLQQFSRVH